MYQVSIVALNKNSCFFSPDVALITEDDRKLASLARMSILQGFFYKITIRQNIMCRLNI